jgi:apolipoprotein N-acyltransferase
VIDPTGNCQVKTDIFTRTVALGDVIPKPRMTFYTRFGDVFARLLTVLFFFPLLIHGYSILARKIRR